MKFRNLRLILSVIALLGIGVFVKFHKGAPQFPAISDLSTFEYDKLKSVILDPKQTKVAIAPSYFNPGHGPIYIGTNAKDGTIFKMSLEEVPGTVVEPIGQVRRFVLNATLAHFTTWNQITLSPGEYRVSVADSANVTLSTRQLFLGGVPDQNYQHQLGMAKERRKQRTIADLKQLHEEITRFEKIEKQLKNPNGRIPEQTIPANAWTPPNLMASVNPLFKKFQATYVLKAELNAIRKLREKHFSLEMQKKSLDRFSADLSSLKSEVAQLKVE